MNTSIISYSYSKKLALFECYASLLLKWNQKINLTSITDPEEIRELHFLDSLSLIPEIMGHFNSANVPRETSPLLRLLDIGSGAGFPGLPIKIALPEIEVTLVDSVKKKCDFMKEVIRALSLKRITVLHGRLTEGRHLGDFDIITSRATFKMRDLIRLAIPNLAPNGVIVAMKGLNVTQEIADCQDEIRRYGMNPIEERVYWLPISGKERKILFVSRGTF